MNSATRIIITGIGCLLFFSACKKQWLDAKPQLSLLVPKTIADYQALLDNSSNSSSSSVVGQYSGFNVNQPYLGEMSAGDFYLADAIYNSSLSDNERNAYIWAKDVFTEPISVSDWNNPYKQIYYSNIVLEGIEQITPVDNKELVAWNQVKGSGLFFRAYCHYDIAQQFCKPYFEGSASSDLGIPIRLTSDFNSPSSRSSVKDSYSQILEDLKKAEQILPVQSPTTLLYRLRPTRAAARAMLARVYLSMDLYDSAFAYANASLQLYDSLHNFNTDFTVTATNSPITRLKKEVIFHKTLVPGIAFTQTRLIVDSNLYKLYDVNDKRKSVFFTSNGSNITYRGSYDGSSTPFGGLATDELYLIRAECYARKGNTVLAIQDLNTLYKTRWNSAVPFVPIAATDANDALKKALIERRKELCFRGTRWADLRRLNRYPQFAVTLVRTVNSQQYSLAPNDNKYVLPIPPNVIALSGVQQNPR